MDNSHQLMRSSHECKTEEEVKAQRAGIAWPGPTAQLWRLPYLCLVPCNSCFPRRVGARGSSNTRPQGTCTATLWFHRRPLAMGGQTGRVPILPRWTYQAHLGATLLTGLRWKREVIGPSPLPVGSRCCDSALPSPTLLLQGTPATV